jgi:hypothetical protein
MSLEQEFLMLGWGILGTILVTVICSSDRSEEDRVRPKIATKVLTRAFSSVGAAWLGSTVSIVALIVTAWIGIQTLYASQRPWVTVEEIKTLDPFPNMKTYCRVGYKVGVKNTGVSVGNLYFSCREHWNPLLRGIGFPSVVKNCRQGS